MANHDRSPDVDVQVDRTDDGVAKVSFTVPAAEFEETVRFGLRNVGRNTRMKGFRPGKVPAQVLEKQFGARVRSDAVQHFLNHAYESAVQKNDLKPAAHPRIDVAGLEPEPGQPLTGEFQIYLRPDFELGAYKGLEVGTQPVEATDEEVEAALEDLKRQQSRPEPAGDDGLDPEGMALCRLEFLMEGRDEALLDRDNIRISPKTPPGGIEAEVFEEKLSGATDGAAVDIPITFPDEFPEEEVRGKEGTCRVTVKEAFRIVPPTQEEIFQLMEVEDEDALNTKAKERIQEAKEQQEQARIEGELLDQVIEMHAMTIPQPYLEEQVQAKAAEAKQNLMTQQGLDEEAADSQVADQMDEFRRSTEKALRAVYLMEEIAKAEDLKVSKEEISAEMESIAARNGVELDEVRKYYHENGIVSQLALELLERKIRSFLRESADIRPVSG
ncbi:MAG: trigger factor [Planctomycetota bacterium]